MLVSREVRLVDTNELAGWCVQENFRLDGDKWKLPDRLDTFDAGDGMLGFSRRLEHFAVGAIKHGDRESYLTIQARPEQLDFLRTTPYFTEYKPAATST